MSFVEARLKSLQRRSSKSLDRHLLTRVRRLRNAGREYRPVFVAGASGGGTSLVAVSLGQRFECAGVIFELDVQMLSHSFLSVPRLSSLSSIAEYEDIVTAKPSWSVERGQRDLQDTFRAYCTDPGDAVIVKGPDINLARAQFLDRCCPDARFVMIFRDPAANIEGYRRKWRAFGDQPLSESIRFYRNLYESFLGGAESFGDRVVGVEYEKLVADPDAAFDEIGRRLGLAPTTRIERLDGRADVAGKGLRNVRDGRIEVVTDASQRARDRLDPADLETIRAELGPLHERLRALPYLI